MKQYHFFFLVLIITALSYGTSAPKTYCALTYTDTLQDEAQEQFQLQYDKLVHEQQYYLPAYSMQKINTDICARWTMSDFAVAIEHTIKNLRQQLLTRKGKGYWLRKMLGFVNPGFSKLLTITQELHARILREEAAEKTIAKQCRLTSEPKRRSQEDAMRIRQEAIHENFTSQLNELNQVDVEHGSQKWDEYLTPLTQLIDAIGDKEITIRDALKGAAHLAVRWKTQEKLLGGLGKICKMAKTKALEFADKHPQATPEQYMVTPEGVILNAPNHQFQSVA
jgi:hypothetical protein